MINLTTTFGITMLTLCFLTVFVYMPWVNYFLKRDIFIQKESKVIWLYIGKKTTYSVSWNYCPNWEKPIYRISNNGARKGVKQDSCFDLNIHFYKFVLSFTNWNYNRKLRNP